MFVPLFQSEFEYFNVRNERPESRGRLINAAVVMA